MSRLTWGALALWLVVSAFLVVGALYLRRGPHEEVRTRMIERAAVVLEPMVQNQVDVAMGADAQVAPGQRLVQALVANAHQKGLLALAVFDSDGLAVEAIPVGQGFVELPMGDFLRLVSGAPISRYHAAFNLPQLAQEGGSAEGPGSPVLEVLLPIAQAGRPHPLGFVRYHFDARLLREELGAIDRQMERQTWMTIGGGWLVITGVFAFAYARLRRAGRVIEQGNASLARAERHLTLSTKASALGQITSHLMHSLQGSVAGLQAAVGAGGRDPDWSSAQEYTRRVQVLVQETVELLNDRRTSLAYELSGQDLAELIRHHSESAATDRAVTVRVESRLAGLVDNVRGSLVCLIASNLLQNAIAVSTAGQCVDVNLRPGAGTAPSLYVEVVDCGPGVPESLRSQLFEPGCSGRAGGTGLGLAISRLLAAQIDGALTLEESGLTGSRFRLTIPLPEKRQTD
ncbi:MAG: sensor histidine kinase [Opitutaceae bacterium]|nr:sensor histidine kinase [Opitutaceae bacterium]